MKLPRALTLKQHTDFKAVREKGRSQSSKHLVISHLHHPERESLRYAVITSRKTGRAHERNLIRRRIRALLVEHGQDLKPGLDLVFIARWNTKQANYADLRTDFLKLAKRLNLLRK